MLLVIGLYTLSHFEESVDLLIGERGVLDKSQKVHDLGLGMKGYVEPQGPLRRLDGEYT